MTRLKPLLLLAAAAAAARVSPLLLGTYSLRATNDRAMLASQFTFLILNDEANIKLKSIRDGGFLATKVSKTGTVEFLSTATNAVGVAHSLLLGGLGGLGGLGHGRADFDVLVRFNNVNKYSYSLFGIEFPEFRYEQISNYSTRYRMRAAFVNRDTLYVRILDSSGHYYLFDLCRNAERRNKLPYG